MVQNQSSYASILKQASPQPPNNTFNFTAEQIVSVVTNVVLQIAQPQLCAKNLPEKQVQAKSDLSKQIAETAKKCLGVNITGKDVFESIISRPAPPPPAPFVFSSTLVEKKKAPPLKASMIINKATQPLVTPSSNTTKSTKDPSLGPQRKSSSKLSPPQHKTSTKPSPNKRSSKSACQLFNSKHKQFGCVKPKESGQTLLDIAKDLKLFYVNQLEPNRHTREDTVHGTPDILDMAFITPGLSSRDISFSVADDHMGSDYFPIQISLGQPLLTEPRYRFDKTNDDLPHNKLKDSLTNIDTNITTQDELKKLAITLCDKLMKAVDTSTPKVYSRNDPKSPISQAILDLIKKKSRLRRLYNNTQDPNIKSTINKLQKEIGTKINQESTISWEKFCNSISLESDPKKSWCKITNFLKLKGPRSYPTLRLGNKTAKTNPEKAQLFVESVERNFGIESHLFSKSQFDHINKFLETHSYHLTPSNSLYDNITDTDDDRDLVASVDPDTLIRIVRTELKNGKSPGIDNVCNSILKKAIGTGFYKVLARAFTISLKFYSTCLADSSPLYAHQA